MLYGCPILLDKAVYDIVSQFNNGVYIYIFYEYYITEICIIKGNKNSICYLFMCNVLLNLEYLGNKYMYFNPIHTSIKKKN